RPGVALGSIVLHGRAGTRGPSGAGLSNLCASSRGTRDVGHVTRRVRPRASGPRCLDAFRRRPVAATVVAARARRPVGRRATPVRSSPISMIVSSPPRLAVLALLVLLAPLRARAVGF